ncbi:MAG TPA: hypothetical protein VHC49_26760 [Mycobacteriales bacterium]|nr:hypothetical protein [Mycobacteriales bacterium]
MDAGRDGIAALRRIHPRIAAGEPVELSASGRSAVLRVPVTGAPVESVVVKGYPAAEGPGALENEAIAATLFTELPGEPVGPRLLACDLARRVLVFADLGQHPGLSDLLLASDRGAAEAGLLAWAAGLGRIAVSTRDPRPRVETIRRGLGIPAVDRSVAGWLGTSLEALPDRVERRFGVAAPPGLDADLAALRELLEPLPYEIFSPADACPDNNQITPDGVRFFDFEFAGIYSLFIDAAYTTLPFPTCWCTLDCPAEVVSATAAAYREQVVTAFPELGEDGPWYDGLRRGSALCLITLLNPVLDGTPGDIEAGRFEAAGVDFPGLAARTHFRLQRLLALPGDGPLMDLLRGIDERLLAECGPLSVPMYPAFRAG